MPDIKIIQLKIRRGTNAQRKLVTLAEGEMGYCIDTKRTFIGDGFTLGGSPLTNKIQVNGTPPTSTPSEVGDITIYESRQLQLINSDYTDINNWSYVGPATDNSTIGLSSNGSNYQLHLIQSGVQLLSGLEYSNAVNLSGIKVRVDSSTIEIDSTTNNLQVKDQGTTTAKIADGAVTTIKIAVSAVTTDKIKDGDVTFAKLASTNWGYGLSANDSINVNVLNDPQTLTLSANGGYWYNTLVNRSDSFPNLSAAALSSFPFVGYTVNKWGVITSNKNFLSGYSDTKPLSDYKVAGTGGNHLHDAPFVIPLDFTSLVPGLSGYVYLHAQP